MEVKASINNHLLIVKRLITDTDYHLNNLISVTNLTDEEKKVFESLLVLRNYRSNLWYLIVLDLTKLLSTNNNEKFNLWKLINKVNDHRKKSFWMHPIDLQKLHRLTNHKTIMQGAIKNLVDIRDTYIAHFDDVELKFKITIDELSQYLLFCKEVHNEISYWLNEGTTLWACSPMDIINPVIFRLNAYSKIRDLFFENHSLLKKEISMAEISKILRPGASSY